MIQHEKETQQPVLNGIFEGRIITLKQLMRLFEHSDFFDGIKEISRYMGAIEGKDKAPNNEFINSDVYNNLIAVCEANEKDEPKFTDIKNRLENLYSRLRLARDDANKIYGECREVLGIIYGLLSDTRLFIITSIESNFLNEKYDTIEPLMKTYPDISTDLFEAVMCWGLNRPTACVAHLMRAMEYAFKLLATRFDEDRISDLFTWNAKLDVLKKKIDALEDKEEKEYFENIYSDLNTVRRRWRNKTMHLERIYQAQEARKVFDAVMTFLDDLSEKLTPPPQSLPPVN